jgi:hypothetical protein
MTRFIIQSSFRNARTGQFAGWFDEPNGSFDTLAEAQAAMQSLVDVCGYDYDHMRIIETSEGAAQ